MSYFLVIIYCLPVLGLVWWAWADWRLRSHRPRGLRWWRLGAAAWALTQFLGFGFLFAARAWQWPLWLPLPLLISVYLWHLVIVPITLAIILLGFITRSATRLARRATQSRPLQSNFAEPAAVPACTRRELLAAAAVALPPLVTAGAVAAASIQLPDFRIRRFTIPVANLPEALDGVTIAHVSDIHVGRFTSAAKLRAIVEQTNALDADLVLMTGDLIDFALSDLPGAIDVVQRLRPRFGLYTCEGNHDLIQDRFEFEQRVRKSGVPLLLNESRLLGIRGQRVQILGMRWGDVTRQRRDATVKDNMDRLLALKRADAFPIVLSHHPHAFDQAADAGVPLVLAGHTHGGQLMLTERIGPGPLMFKYWSGLYQKPGSSLVVSNGVGNWFPLRINAPAEIVHIRLERAGT